MSGFGALWQVASREVRERGRSKAYIIASTLTLLIVAGIVILPNVLDDGVDEIPVGSLGEGNDVIIATAEQLATADDEPGEPASVVYEVTEYQTRDEAETGLEEGEVDAVLVDGSEVIVQNNTGIGGNSTVGRLQRAAATVEIEMVVETEGQAAIDIIELLTSDPLETTSLSGDDEQTDEQTIVAYAGMILLYVAILLYGTWILSGVTEEKANRVVEVLLSSIRPWQILGGKILGIGLLAFAQVAAVLVVALVGLQATGGIELPDLGPKVVINLLVWFILGFFIYAVLFGAAGSLVSRMEDAQSVALPMTMSAVAGFFISVLALDDPTGTVAVVGSFVPVTAPFVVPLRSALDAIPLWQYGAAVVIALLSIAALTVAAGRIYAGGLLRFGTRVKLREAWRGGLE